MKRPCPICAESAAPHAENPFFPFCSERCQMVDLGRWLDGDYSIPGEAVDVERQRDEHEH